MVSLFLIDIGGTYTKYKILNENFKIIKKGKLKISDKKDFFSFLKKIKEFYPPEISIFSVAGPVLKESFFITNWREAPEISYLELKNELKCKRIFVLNDMEAQGFGFLELKSKKFKDFFKIFGPEKIENEKSFVLIVPGTGLGTCAILNGIPFSSELQHSGFSFKEPLKNVFEDPVSYEDFVSGEGLFKIYSFFKGKDFKIKGDRADFVRKKALEGDKEAIKSINTYFFALANYCQAVSLAYKPFGGIYIAGKAIKKNFPFFLKEKFIEFFLNNKRQRKFLEKIPIYFILKDLIFHGLLHFLKNIVKYEKVFKEV